jgi:hypothetical protein
VPEECNGLTEDKRNAHSVPGANLVGDVAEDDGDDGTTADGGDEERCTALGVASKTCSLKSALVPH